MSQVVQVLGSLLILVPFVLVSLGRMRPSTYTYIVLNLVGSIVLTVDAAHGHQWGFLLLEAVWALTSLISLLRLLAGRPPTPTNH